MRHNQSQPAAVRYAMPGVVALLAILALVPVQWLGWTRPLATLETVLVAPISQPLREVAVWLAPATRDAPPEAIAELEARRDELLATLRREQAENRRLRETIRELQSGRAIRSPVPVRQVLAPVIASQSDPSGASLTIRAGLNVGLTDTTVATVRGTQLVGRVRRLGATTSMVVPITSRQHTAVQGGVVVEPDGREEAVLLECLLLPVGDGRLRGDVEFDSATEPEVGMEVVLRDDLWPESAQFLIIGDVERVEPDPEQPLRKVIFVQPRVDDLRRVSEVVLRIPELASGSEGGGS